MRAKNLFTSVIPFIILAFAMIACGGGDGDTVADDPVAEFATEVATNIPPTEPVSPTPTAVTILPQTGPVTITITEPVVEAPAAGQPADVDRSAFVAPVGQPTTNEISTPPESATDTTTEPVAEPVAEAAPEPISLADLPEGCLDTLPVADVTIPDGVVLNPGETFTKIWRLRNSGTCEWNDALGELRWVFVSGAQMDGPSQVAIAGPVAAGADYDVELELTAPAEPGLHEGRWQVQSASGDPIGVVFWVLIDVSQSTAGTPPSETAPVDASSSGGAGGAPPSTSPGPAREVWQHINGARDIYKMTQYAYNEKLALAAQAHAEDCSQRGDCSHTGSDGSDEAVRVRRYGYQGSVDESWVWSSSSYDAVAWWLDEVPPDDWHRRMVLSDWATEVGVGVAPAPGGGDYFIAVFGITGH